MFQAQPERWILKGGHALLTRYHRAARLSQDVDIQHDGAIGIKDAVTALRAAARSDLGDYLHFEPARLSTHQNGAAGAKQKFDVYRGAHQVDTLRVDVVAVQRPITAPDLRTITPLIDLGWPADWPQARLYPIVDHLADKVCALYERHRGIPSTRWRDLADILLISRREALDGHACQMALRAEAQRRAQAGTDLHLPGSFEPPGPAWPARYPTAALQVPGLNGCTTWAQAASAAAAFLTPLLAAHPPGHWNPAEAAWHPQPQRHLALTPAHLARLGAITDAVTQRTAAAPAPVGRRPARPRPDVPPPAAGPTMTPGR
ncbi:nucleotidyl transferase AbiEii/AbiGii toxin family protein [Streptomyces sp. TLI_146]|uniref:nucleotidyl transferase AbiEii/AbiGii toxin family protein n=1 Tax=Streptomyces sp. TLI_146 TaxID=1938858 RepID=UPI000CA8A99D|nr:nucleotidyl transferase AbiEii/AbiGii toxin family protein [Streptomyces sp. TLI_146]PKV82593.1 nucleotidyltransferase AbiEii toxin of type IV toxin-antitoxin system [Streptomyces sp. TLI_146]